MRDVCESEIMCVGKGEGLRFCVCVCVCVCVSLWGGDRIVWDNFSSLGQVTIQRVIL